MNNIEEKSMEDTVFENLAGAHPFEMYAAYPEDFLKYYNKRTGQNVTADELDIIMKKMEEEIGGDE